MARHAKPPKRVAHLSFCGAWLDPRAEQDPECPAGDRHDAAQNYGRLPERFSVTLFTGCAVTGGLPAGRDRKPRDDNGKRGQTMQGGKHPRRPMEKEKVAQPVLGEGFNIGWLAGTDAQSLFQPGQGAHHAKAGFPSDKRDQA